MNTVRWLLFDWGDTLMADLPGMQGPMSSWTEIAAMPGTAETLPELSARFPCVVVSNAGDSDAPEMRRALDLVGLGQYFRRFFTSKELGARKPDPAFFRAALRALDCPPEVACMIGND
ncbi:MAG: HAD family hydrolase [Oscillospiraceae bacterium]|jgi:putative hydrolase of the HAD superfamily|nr:HAD family hydrolase [Oscillospiraceae bacterium]